MLSEDLKYPALLQKLRSTLDSRPLQDDTRTDFVYNAVAYYVKDLVTLFWNEDTKDEAI